jgi:RNA polymerase sigma-70 factor, ECF subfamily
LLAVIQAYYAVTRKFTPSPELVEGDLLLMPELPENTTDLDIIRQVLAGAVNVFERLLQRYQPYVLTIVSKHVPYAQVTEVAHDAFVRAYQSLPKYKQTSEFKYWLAAIAVRTCYDFWRKRYRTREVPVSTLAEDQQQWFETALASQAATDFATQTARQHAQEVVTWALQRLSAEDRMVVELVYLEELSCKEAARLLGWSVANVKVRAFRARKLLRKLLIRRNA